MKPRRPSEFWIAAGSVVVCALLVIGAIALHFHLWHLQHPGGSLRGFLFFPYQTPTSVTLDPPKDPMTLRDIAKVCHETNRAYCATLGDTSQLPWEDAPEWQRTSAIKGVEFRLLNPTAPASASHDSWLAEKRATGWMYGPVKDAEKKEHPCFVPYDELPTEQKAKDALFIRVVDALVPLLPDPIQ